jgi:hypothetical protein
MKPLNLDNSPCSPTSSNCIIWQGPSLDCIKLCKGDTISEVTAKLATELCTVMAQLNVNDYDLSCFDLTTCAPVDFQALIQFLINHICALENLTPTSGSNGSPACPDCVVTMAPCFVQNNQTTSQLVDYVNLIAQRICSLITEIEGLQTQITDLNTRVFTLESNAAQGQSYTLPSVIVDYTLQDIPFIGLNGPATEIDIVLNALINDPTYGYGALRTATGLPAELVASVASQTITSSRNSLTYGTAMSVAYAGWISTPLTIADTITDAWISILDIFTYLETTVSTTIVTAGDNIVVTPVTVGTTTTYTVGSTGTDTIVAGLIINDARQPINGAIATKTPALVTGLLDSQIIYRYNSFASNNVLVEATATPGAYVATGSIPVCRFGSFDNETTGEFTVSETGTYLIEATANLKSDNTSSVYWQTGVDAGSFGIGVLKGGTEILVGQYQSTLPSINKNVNVSTSVTAYLVDTTVIKIGLLNLTDRSYTGNGYTSADNITFSITQIKK